MSSVLPPVSANSAQSVIDLENRYLLQNYARYPLLVTRGKGCYVYDGEGHRYLDFITGIGVNALGHAHPRIVKAIREQAATLIHSSNLYYHAYQGPLAERLARISGLERAFFANTGTEATEGALKMARAHGRALHPEKYEIVSLDNSFHGRTLGALSVTGQAKYRTDFEPLLPGVKFVRYLPVDARFRGAGPRSGGPSQRPADRRRNAVWSGPARDLLRLPANRTSHSAGRHGGRQAAGVRDSSRSHHGQ